jgi:hypothetical protein
VDTEKIVRDIDAEIARLTSVRNILTESGSNGQAGLARKDSEKVRPDSLRGRRRLTTAGRRRLSELMKKRWAERRKGASKAK